MRTHTGTKPWKCKYCDKTFAHHANRTRHEISHTGEFFLVISVQSTMNDKFVTFTGVKPHKCSFCEKSFIRKRQLVEHESIHTGKIFLSNPSSCSEKVERSAKTSNQLSPEEKRLRRCQICTLVVCDARTEHAVLLCRTVLREYKRDRWLFWIIIVDCFALLQLVSVSDEEREVSTGCIRFI